jgi:nitrogen-specific signal transduction histidine kinase
VINDILDFSKVEAGRLELTHVSFDLEQVLEQLADMFSNRLTQKDIELVFTRAPQLPRQLTGDAGRLIQVLTNLIEMQSSSQRPARSLSRQHLINRLIRGPGGRSSNFRSATPAQVLPPMCCPPCSTPLPRPMAT